MLLLVIDTNTLNLGSESIIRNETVLLIDGIKDSI